MRTVEFQLRGEIIELCQLLKGAGLAEPGGRGKLLVAAGQVRVDGRPESRKTAKIRAGQTVECLGTTVNVCAPRQPDPSPPG